MSAGIGPGLAPGMGANCVRVARLCRFGVAAGVDFATVKFRRVLKRALGMGLAG